MYGALDQTVALRLMMYGALDQTVALRLMMYGALDQTVALRIDVYGALDQTVALRLMMNSVTLVSIRDCLELSVLGSSFWGSLGVYILTQKTTKGRGIEKASRHSCAAVGHRRWKPHGLKTIVVGGPLGGDNRGWDTVGGNHMD